MGVGEEVHALDDAADHLAHAVLDEPRPAVRLLDHRALVAALHQLVDLRGHRVLDDGQQRLGVDVVDARLRAADVQRAEAALVVRGHGDRLEDPLDLGVGEAVGQQPLARARLDQRLRARAGGHPLGADADKSARSRFAGHRRAEQRVDLLGLDARYRGRLVLGVARLDVHLGAQRVLAVAHELGDVAARSALSPRTTSPRASLTTSSKRLMCAPFWCGPRSTKQSSRAEYSCSAPLAWMRMTFSTLVTPTRESESERVGARFWTSSRDRVMTRKARPGRMDQGFAKDKLCIACYKAGTALASSRKRPPANHNLAHRD